MSPFACSLRQRIRHPTPGGLVGVVSSPSRTHVCVIEEVMHRDVPCRFVTFEDDSAVERVFGAGRMHTIGGKSVEVKPATPRGSGPTGIAISRGFPMVLPGRGMAARGGFAEMAPAAAAGYPGAPYQGYAGMVPFATGGRLQPMVRGRPLRCCARWRPILPDVFCTSDLLALRPARMC